ncbi:hypothetical protein L915_10747 [Phytophthora nicotianae]|nr:hypothetical protein L915_10747 [Phytophthora nicotianae]
MYSEPQLRHIRVPENMGIRIREISGGCKHKLSLPYELQVLEYFDNCISNGEVLIHAAVLVYRQQFPEFAIKKDKSQQLLGQTVHQAIQAASLWSNTSGK